MCDNDRYVKYNRLIESFRYVILKQRTHDLYELSKCVSPNTLGKMDNEKLESMIRSGDKKISISYVGKYMIREKSVENSNLCWYIKKSDGKLYKDSHVSYM